jgi:hypothetical protein
MPKREPIAAANIPTAYGVARMLQDLAEAGRITPAQFRALASVLTGYAPAHMALEQRTPHGAVYAIIQTSDDTFTVTVDHRAHVRHG